MCGWPVAKNLSRRSRARRRFFRRAKRSTPVGAAPTRWCFHKMKLRFWFLLPTRICLVLLLAAPLAIICVYSVLTRGAYGGVIQPWTAENFARFFDPLYAVILWR